MDFSIRKKSLLVLAIVWIIITFYLINSSYAKYLTDLHANTNISVSTWNLTVNTLNIQEEDDITEKLQLTFPGNEYALEDVIVPGVSRILWIKYRLFKNKCPFLC